MAELSLILWLRLSAEKLDILDRHSWYLLLEKRINEKI